MLFLLHRPGLVVVSGIVTDINGSSVTVTGNVALPVSKKIEKRSAKITFKKQLSIAPKKGEQIIATTEDDFSVGSLFDGIETSEKIYYLNGYNARYSGAFDFEQRGECKEQHVFAGTIVQVKHTQKGYTMISLNVRSGNKNTCRYLVEFSHKDYKVGQSAIFVTGPGTPGKSGTIFYPVI